VFILLKLLLTLLLGLPAPAIADTVGTSADRCDVADQPAVDLADEEEKDDDLAPSPRIHLPALCRACGGSDLDEAQSPCEPLGTTPLARAPPLT